MKKEYGILMPVFSMDNAYAIGSFGEMAKKFIDILNENGFTWWQILPLCTTDNLNSPYNSTSIYSINPYYIDLEMLFLKGLISHQDLLNQQIHNNGRCDYLHLKKTRMHILYKAFLKFTNTKELNNFIGNNPQIKKFCKFQALSEKNHTSEWQKWTSLDYEKEIERFWQFLQYEAYMQWDSLKQYANSKNVKIMGDLPMYSSYCSSDVYFFPHFYQFDENKKPIYLSGAKPDDFSSVGQCWGHPVYNWENIRNNNFCFWIDKFAHYSKLFDGIRLDHFRGFESYWVVPSTTKNALDGHYEKGPGFPLFSAAKKHLNSMIVVGEDLGITTNSVQDLINKTGFYNMRVLQYCLINSEDLPVNYSQNCIAYTGTHDNHTLKGYINSLGTAERNELRQILNIPYTESLYDGIVLKMCQSNAKIIFFPLQDIIGLDDNFVFNTHKPSVYNWSFRLNKLESFEKTLKKFVKDKGIIS